MSKSCEGCKFLFGDGSGYSDWTWMDTNIVCAIGNNPDLPKEECYDMSVSKMLEKIGGRCSRYSNGPYIVVSPDGDLSEDFCDSGQEEAIRNSRWIPDKPGID